MSTQELILWLVLTFSLSTGLVAIYRRFAITHGLQDIPNERSSHSKITPRGGGIAFALVWIVLNIYLGFRLSKMEFVALLPGSIMVAAIGFFDDLYQVKASIRALVHLIAAAFMVKAALLISSPTSLPLGGPLLFALLTFVVLGVAWSVNVFNFMDGMDGLAATEAIFVFGVGGYLIWEKSQSAVGASALLLTAAVAGFLVWNRPPARIFMGDIGSGFLGFLIGAFAMLSFLSYGIPLLIWVILYGAFWYDATITLIRRVLAKEKWYTAHRTHAYQRLHHLAKWSHARVLTHVIGLNLILAAFALVGYRQPQLLSLLFVLTLLLLTLAYAAIERIAPFKNKQGLDLHSTQPKLN